MSAQIITNYLREVSGGGEGPEDDPGRLLAVASVSVHCTIFILLVGPLMQHHHFSMNRHLNVATCRRTTLAAAAAASLL